MSVPLTALPFGLPGRIFRSPMPFGQYDLHGEVYDRFCEEQIAVIVLLASDEECLHKTGCNLRAMYQKAGFQVLYLPIPDCSVPTRDDLEQAVQHTIAYAQAGHHIVIHCSAGIGRTGLFTAYLAKRCLDLSGAEALDVPGLEKSSWLLPGERKGGIRFLGLSIPVEACLTIPNWQIFPTILQLLKKCDENAPS